MARRKVDRTQYPRQIITILLLLVGISWLCLLIFGIFRKQEIARQAAADTKVELTLLEERRGTLTANLAELNTERGQEATMRQQYGVARPGEEVIIVVPKKELSPPPELTFWQRVKEFMSF